MKSIINYFRDQAISSIDINEESRLKLHASMFEKKRLLQDVFKEFHFLFNSLACRFFSGSGIEVELGAGVAPMRNSFPKVLATDIVNAAHLDRVINAEAMNFADASIKAIYAQNCFHHFSHPDRFFNELDRVLISGGGAVLIEPYHGLFASFLFKRLFRTEGFDKTVQSWDTPDAGVMSDANQALSYIIFIRDRSEFERKHPSLKVVYTKTIGNYVKYIISGGLNFKQLLPNRFNPFISLIQYALSPFDRWLALHHVIVIKKI